MLIKPNEVRSRKKQRKLGTEVADLKLKLGQSNKNIVLSNREIRLLRYVLEIVIIIRCADVNCSRLFLQVFRFNRRGERKTSRLSQSGSQIGKTWEHRTRSVRWDHSKWYYLLSAGRQANDDVIFVWIICRSNSDSDEDIEVDTADQEYPSLDSVPSDNSLPGNTTFSPRSSEPPSLTESMQLMDEILSDKTMDRIERIDKLEAILSAATLLPNDPVCLTRLWWCYHHTKCVCICAHFSNSWSLTISRSLLRQPLDHRIHSLIRAAHTIVFISIERKRQKGRILSLISNNSNTSKPAQNIFEQNSIKISIFFSDLVCSV